MNSFFRWLYASTIICGITIIMNSGSDDFEERNALVCVSPTANHRHTAEHATQNAFNYID